MIIKLLMEKYSTNATSTTSFVAHGPTVCVIA